MRVESKASKRTGGLPQANKVESDPAAAAKPSKPKTSKPVHRPPSASSEPTPDQADEDDDEPTPSEDPGGEDGD